MVIAQSRAGAPQLRSNCARVELGCAPWYRGAAIRSMRQQYVHAGDDRQAQADRQHLLGGFDRFRPAMQAGNQVCHRHIQQARRMRSPAPSAAPCVASASA